MIVIVLLAVLQVGNCLAPETSAQQLLSPLLLFIDYSVFRTFRPLAESARGSGTIPERRGGGAEGSQWDWLCARPPKSWWMS